MTVLGIPQAIFALERRKIAALVAEPIAAKAGGTVVAAAMKAQAPRDTGQLAASIVVEMDGDTAHVGSTAPYDRFVQLGTRYMAAQPYGREAGDETETPVEAAMAAIFKIAMK